ncbi:competence protein ComFC [Gammaproteobacteria bacterium]
MTNHGRFSIFEHTSHLLKFLENQLLPRVCVFCGALGESIDLCPKCRAGLPWLLTPVPEQSYLTFVAFSYVPPIDQYIIGLKFRDRLSNAFLLGSLLADRLSTREEPFPEVIVPVPLHPTRLRTRGYNQSLEVARPIARRFGLSTEPFWCQRVRATKAQLTLSFDDRQENVRGAFVASSAVAGKRIAVLDDVITTGATATEVGNALLKAGAKEIEIWALARTQLHTTFGVRSEYASEADAPQKKSGV